MYSGVSVYHSEGPKLNNICPLAPATGTPGLTVAYRHTTQSREFAFWAVLSTSLMHGEAHQVHVLGTSMALVMRTSYSTSVIGSAHSRSTPVLFFTGFLQEFRMTLLPCCPKVTLSCCQQSLAEPKLLACLGQNVPLVHTVRVPRLVVTASRQQLQKHRWVGCWTHTS